MHAAAVRTGLLVFVVLVVTLGGCLGASNDKDDEPTDPRHVPTHGPDASQPELAADVRAEFLHTYLAYQRLAGDHDELHPISGTGSDFFAEGHPVALSTIESLDTLYLMELDAELADAIETAAAVDFDIDADFQVFETVIRLVGGLLSGHHATGDERLLDQARDLTDRLMPAFEKSPTGLPYRYVNLRTGQASGTENFLAEIGTCITEFGYLSQETGDPRYFDAAKKALKAVYDRRSMLDLVGTTLNVETGEWTDPDSTINPPVDSFYEYLWDGYYLLGDQDLLEWYNTLTDALVERQSIEVPAIATGIPPVTTHLWFSESEYQTGVPRSTIQSELAAFYAGLLAESGRVDLGRRYHDSWADALERGGYRILPECIDPATLQTICPGNHLRPEYVDAALYLWLATDDTLYVDRAVDYYIAMKDTSRTENGYTVLADVTTRPETQGDLTSGYWYSENMKYYYLMFGRPQRIDFDTMYMTTEGNVLRGFVKEV